MSMKRKKRLVVGVSGASGISLAVNFLRLAASSDEIERLHLVVSNNALRVGAHELDPPATTPAAVIERCGLEPDEVAKIEIHPAADIGASIASGSYKTDGMIVIPCSSGTLASIAHGTSRGLIQRAADLTLKERRTLILVLRETPLSLIHAENIVTATRAGAIVMPPIPSFYAGESWDASLRHFAMRALDLFGIELEMDELRWG
jgi:polyprenyl P-hydroxybenzoate/phenylacrylic acid decarboxylase-like protein